MVAAAPPRDLHIVSIHYPCRGRMLNVWIPRREGWPLKLNHVDLQVSDVNVAGEFFETFFGLRCTYQRAGQIALLEDEAGFSLGVSNLRGSPPPTYPPDFHVGFVLERTGDVRDVYTRLKTAGVAMKFDLQEAGPNLAFQCLGPDSIPVEVRSPLDRG